MIDYSIGFVRTFMEKLTTEFFCLGLYFLKQSLRVRRKFFLITIVELQKFLVISI